MTETKITIVFDGPNVDADAVDNVIAIEVYRIGRLINEGFREGEVKMDDGDKTDGWWRIEEVDSLAEEAVTGIGGES